MMRNKFNQKTGFTVIELMIGLVIMSITAAAAFKVYQTQKKINDVQEQLIEQNQNLRAAMFYIEDELKTAGCDPTRRAGAGIIVADSSELRFTRDITGGELDNIDNDQDGLVDELRNDGIDNDEDGWVDDDDADERYNTEWYDGSTDDAGEDITYTLYDAYSDGDMDLGRKSGDGTNVPVAENIDVLDFVYLDGNGNVLSPLPLSPSQRANVRSVEVSIVARSRKPDPEYENNESYYNLQNTLILGPQQDHYHRKLLTMTVKCRNLGL